MSLSKGCCVLLLLGVTIVAVVWRVPRLQQRPMHGDEAIHAEKFGDLLEQGLYTYDPIEYHGPTLNYLSLIPAWLSSAQKLTEVTETTLRIVPVFFGVLLVLSPLFVADGLGRIGTVVAAGLTTVSPAMVFYSRYYIMEILLVWFTFGVIICGYRYARSGNLLWMILAGAFVGLMHATKETCIIAFAALLAALLLMMIWQRKSNGSLFGTGKSMRPWHFIVGLAGAAVVSVLFFSSFFTHPAGIMDSFTTYATYFGRAGGDSIHIHPWYYYLKVLLFSRYGGGPAWSEASIVVLAVAGLVVAITKKGLREADAGLLRFIAIYTVIMTVVYSAIPYKTPWCMLGFQHGMILLAAVGAAAMIRLAPSVLPRIVIIGLLLGSAAHLAWQAYLANYVYYADSRNPYVYAHPTNEVFTVVEKIEELARAHPDGRQMYIQVICPRRDYWPLPWYLRAFTNVGWWLQVPEDVPAAPVIIASDKVEAALTRKLYEQTPFEKRKMYLYLFDKPYYVWLRPKVKLIGLVRKDVWDLWQGR
jgi:uncharacterized protein (TIGR03663 family)